LALKLVAAIKVARNAIFFIRGFPLGAN